MAAPLITNIAPVDGSVAVVGASSRFSVRDADTEIDKATLQVYHGSGPVYYPGGTLPENLVGPPTFTFQALSGSPGVYADRAILGDNFLRISKSVSAQNQEAVYFMGGLEAPAEADAPIMVEFTLRLNKTEVVTSGNFTGVLLGLLINNSGLTIKFFTTGVTQTIQLQGAGLTDTTALLTASFDWDEAVALNSDGSNTYKLLWHPQLNAVKLFVKSPNAVEDLLIASGLVTSFPTVPVSERRAYQPWVFFGHGNYTTQTSISEWINVFLFDTVRMPIRNGTPCGAHVTTIESNNQVYFDGTTKMRDARSAWMRLPTTFGAYEGSETVLPSGLEVRRTSLSKSFGFYRKEPKANLVTVFDIKVSAELLSIDPVAEVPGIEFYIDDGTKQARFALLMDSSGVQRIGILADTDPTVLSSYETADVGFGSVRHYRLILTPGVGAELRIFDSADVLVGGVTDVPWISVPYIRLPASGLPGPGVGWILNANTGPSLAKLLIQQLRYSTNVAATNWSDIVAPVPAWTKLGSGTIKPSTLSVESNFGIGGSIVESFGVVTVSGLTRMTPDSVGNYLDITNGDRPGYYLINTFVDTNTVTIVSPTASGADSGNPGIEWREVYDPSFIRLSDASSSDNTYLKKEYTSGLQPDTAWTVETRARVVSYEHDAALTPYRATGLNPIRSGTGFSVRVLDGTFKTSLVFAHGGPRYGRIVFLNVSLSAYADLQLILSKSPLVIGTYATVDWTLFHLYRIEKNRDGRLRLFVDNAAAPVIDLDERTFAYPPHVGGGNPRVEIGHDDTGIKTVSDLEFIRLTLSDGYDVSTKVLMDEDALLAKFKHGTNVIVEVRDV